MSRRSLHAIAGPLLAGLAIAQAAPPPEPIDLIARGEQLLTAGDHDQGIVVLWQALDALAARTQSAATTASIATAQALLTKHDPLETDRRTARTAFARANVDIATSYRSKKWLDTASELLDFAERFDRAATLRERTLLAPSRPKAASDAPTRVNPLFRRDATFAAKGPWQESGDTLHCGAAKANDGGAQWILAQPHEDCELSIEFRADDPKLGHDCAIVVGRDNNSLSCQINIAYYPEHGNYTLTIFEENVNESPSLGYVFLDATQTPDGFHSLTVQIHDTTVRAQFDDAKPFEVKTRVAPRGHFGVIIGIQNQDSSAITFRNFTKRSLPHTAFADEAKARAEIQKRIAKALDAATDLLAKKQPEAAATRLRDAANDAKALPAGAVRDSLAKSVDDALAKADPLTARIRKAAQDAARTFVALADRYATAGHVHAAYRIAALAADLDPDGCKARLAAAQQAVEKLAEQRKDASGR